MTSVQLMKIPHSMVSVFSYLFQELPPFFLIVTFKIQDIPYIRGTEFQFHMIYFFTDFEDEKQAQNLDTNYVDGMEILDRYEEFNETIDFTKSKSSPIVDDYRSTDLHAIFITLTALLILLIMSIMMNATLICLLLAVQSKICGMIQNNS